MDLVRTALAFLVAAGTALTAAAQPYAYSVRSNADDHLYRIDLANGEATDLGALAFDDAEGLAFVDQELFAIAGTVEELWKITAPPGLLVGATGPRDGADAGLAWNPVDRRLYNLNAGPGSTLYEIDPDLGTAMPIGSSPFFADGLAIDGSGNTFATDVSPVENTLYRVDLDTGWLTPVGPLAVVTANESGLAFAPDGTLWAIAENGELFTVDPASGLATFAAQVHIGALALDGFEGLAIPAPLPWSIPVLGLFGMTMLVGSIAGLALRRLS